MATLSDVTVPAELIGWPHRVGRCAAPECDTAITTGVFCEPCEWRLFPPTTPAPVLGLTRLETCT
jgi:hypothetical protein